MTQNFKAADLVGKVIVLGENFAKYIVKSVDGDKLSCDFIKEGMDTTSMSISFKQVEKFVADGKWSISDTESATVIGGVVVATEAHHDVTTDADVAEVDDIVPVVKPKAKPVEEEPDPDAVGELVYEEPKAKVEPIKPTAKPKQEKPKAKSVVGSTYRVELLPTKDGQKWPKLYGFKDESEAKKTAGKMAKTVTYSWDRDEQGEKRYYLKGGKKYCEVFQQLADALNIGEKAVIDKVCKASVAIFEGARAEGKKKSDCNATLRPKVREGRGKTEDVHQPSSVSSQTSTEKTYTAAEVMDLIQRMAKKDPKALAEYEAMLQAA